MRKSFRLVVIATIACHAVALAKAGRAVNLRQSSRLVTYGLSCRAKSRHLLLFSNLTADICLPWLAVVLAKAATFSFLISNFFSTIGRMKTSLIVTAFFAATSLAVSSFAQQTTTSPVTGGKVSNAGQVPVPANPAGGTGASAPTGQPNAADMMKQMMELSKIGENHKLLSSLDGNWDYTIKFWMNPDPSAKPQESKGTATRKSVMGGRYVMMDVSGKMQMPGEDGKMKTMQFKGMGMEGYDNVKKKFVASWIDNMGTGIEFSEGTYDPATKSFTYTSEMEPVPGMKTSVREVVKVADNNHMSLEWYENQGGQEKKTMEINYTKKK